MSTTTAQRRKPPKSLETLDVPSGNNNATNNGGAVTVATATVRRRKFGTGPFDEHWLNVDCCGLICACMTYALHMYAVYTVCFIMIPPWMSIKGENGERILTATGMFHRVCFTAIAAMACLSHFKAMTTNPGAVPPDAKPVPSPEELNAAKGGGANGSGGAVSGEEESPLVNPKPKTGMRLCRRCNAFKPRRAHHCSVCRRCVIKMDHHCPWVNNCVGIGNHKYFLLFVFYTLLSCAYTIVILISWFTICMQHNTVGGHGRGHVRDVACLDSPKHLLNLLGLIVEAVLFGMFTSCMMVDQSDVISSKMTHIDRLKGGGEVGVASLGGVAEVFGVGARGGLGAGASRFRPDWLSPFARVCFPPSVQDDIMGFCRPCVKACSADKETELAPTRGMVRSVAEIV